MQGIKPASSSSLSTPLLKTSSLSGLTTIRPPTLRLLISTHTGTKCQIYSRRRAKPKALRHLDQIQLMHIKNGPQTMTSVCLQITSIAIFRTLIQIVVLGNQFLELGLHVYYFLGGEIEFDDWDSGGFEVGEETDFGGV